MTQLFYNRSDFAKTYEKICAKTRYGKSAGLTGADGSNADLPLLNPDYTLLA